MDLLSLELAGELHRDRARMMEQSRRAPRAASSAGTAADAGRLRLVLHRVVRSLVQQPASAG